MKIILIGIVFAAFSGCDLILDESSETDSLTHKSVLSDGILYSLSIPVNSFNLSDSLSMTFKVTNNSLSERTFGFPNIQQFGFRLTDDQNNVDMYFPYVVQPATSAFSLQPRESKIYHHSGPFKNHEGNYINKGYYKLSAYLLGEEYPLVSLNILVN